MPWSHPPNLNSLMPIITFPPQFLRFKLEGLPASLVLPQLVLKVFITKTLDQQRLPARFPSNIISIQIRFHPNFNFQNTYIPPSERDLIIVDGWRHPLGRRNWPPSLNSSSLPNKFTGRLLRHNFAFRPIYLLLRYATWERGLWSLLWCCIFIYHKSNGRTYEVFLSPFDLKVRWHCTIAALHNLYIWLGFYRIGLKDTGIIQGAYYI